MTDLITQKNYDEQSIWRTASKFASRTIDNFSEGVYKLSKVAVGILSYPLYFIPGGSQLADALNGMKERFTVMKKFQNGTMIFPQIEQWAKYAKNEDNLRSKGFMETTKRVGLTAGGVLKLGLYAHECQLLSLGQLATRTIGNLPLLKTISDSIFLGVFTVGVVNSGCKWASAASKRKKATRLRGDWNQLVSMDQLKARRDEKMNPLKKKLAKIVALEGKTAKEGKGDFKTLREEKLKKWKSDQTQAETKKKEKLAKAWEKMTPEVLKARREAKLGAKSDIVSKVKKMESKIANEQKVSFDKLKAAKLDVWTVNQTNEHLNVKKAALGLFSDLGKITAILVSTIAMAIFGWAGLIASLTITTIALVADLCGLTKFAHGIHKVVVEDTTKETLKVASAA